MYGFLFIYLLLFFWWLKCILWWNLVDGNYRVKDEEEDDED